MRKWDGKVVEGWGGESETSDDLAHCGLPAPVSYEEIRRVCAQSEAVHGCSAMKWKIKTRHE